MQQNNCPFCGSNKVKIIVANGFTRLKASGRCNCCHARGPIISKEVRSYNDIENIRKDIIEEATKLWNNRA